MPRDSGGAYTLPAGNPVVTGTIIESIWANDTMEDIAVQLNNVITRDGLLGPLLPMLFVDGTEALPGIAFALSPSTGFYRYAPNNVGLAIAGVAKQTWTPTGSQIDTNLEVTGTLDADGNVTFGGDVAIAGDVSVAGSITGGLSVVGPLLMGDGTALLPAYSFTSDPDTGIYRVAAGNIGFATEGILTAALVTGGFFSTIGSAVNTNGVQVTNTNSGVGAAAAFIAQNNLGQAFQLIMTSSTFTGYALAGVNAGLLHTTGEGGLIINSGFAGTNIRFATGGATEQMRLTSTGTLGINCVPAAASIPFRIQQQAANDVGLEWQRLSASIGELRSFDRNATNWTTLHFGANSYQWNLLGVASMVFTSTGLGIFTTPTHALHVAGAGLFQFDGGGNYAQLHLINFGAASGNGARINIQAGGAAIGDAQVHFVQTGVWDWTIGLHAPTSSFRINASSVLSSPTFTITTGLNVGINNAAPGFNLSVLSAASGTPGLHVAVAGAASQGMLQLGDRSRIAGGGDYLGWQFFDLAVSRAHLNTGGYLGLNCTPTYALDIVDVGSGVARITSTGGTSAYLQANGNTDVRVGALSAHDLMLIAAGAIKVKVYAGNGPIYVREGSTDFAVALDPGADISGAGVAISIGAVMGGIAGGPGWAAIPALGQITLSATNYINVWGYTAAVTITNGIYRLITRFGASDAVLVIRVG